MKIGGTKAALLGVQVREKPTLQQWVICESYPPQNIGWAVSNLFGLREEIVRPPIENHPTYHPHRNLFFRNDLGRVQHIKVKTGSELLVKKLQAKLPLGKITSVDCLKQVAALKVRISAGDLDGLIPHGGSQALLRLPMKLHQRDLAVCVDQLERMDTESFHRS